MTVGKKNRNLSLCQRNIRRIIIITNNNKLKDRHLKRFLVSKGNRRRLAIRHLLHRTTTTSTTFTKKNLCVNRMLVNMRATNNINRIGLLMMRNILPRISVSLTSKHNTIMRDFMKNVPAIVFNVGHPINSNANTIDIKFNAMIRRIVMSLMTKSNTNTRPVFVKTLLNSTNNRGMNTSPYLTKNARRINNGMVRNVKRSNSRPILNLYIKRTRVFGLRSVNKIRRITKVRVMNSRRQINNSVTTIRVGVNIDNPIVNARLRKFPKIMTHRRNISARATFAARDNNPNRTRQLKSGFPLEGFHISSPRELLMILKRNVWRLLGKHIQNVRQYKVRNSVVNEDPTSRGAFLSFVPSILFV